MDMKEFIHSNPEPIDSNGISMESLLKAKEELEKNEKDYVIFKKEIQYGRRECV